MVLGTRWREVTLGRARRTPRHAIIVIRPFCIDLSNQHCGIIPTFFMASVATLQPVKHPSFIYYEREPFNGGPPPSMARGEFITPTDLFYVRCHGNIPASTPPSTV